MNLRSSMAFRPSSLVTLLAYAALMALISLTACWYVMLTHIDKRENLKSETIFSQLQSEIENSSQRLHPMKSSSTNLARLLSSALHNDSTISFSDVETKVAPLLFQSLETVPFLAQISYIGTDGLFFSYYTDRDQVVAIYSNSSSSSSSRGASNATSCYIQRVNQDTGEVHGEATASTNHLSIDASWTQEALNVSDNNNNNGYYASIGTGWRSDRNLLLLNSAKIARTGGSAVSLGFSAAAITGLFARNVVGGAIWYLATKDGKALLQEGGMRSDARFVVSNGTVSLQSVSANGHVASGEGSVSCKDDGAVGPSLEIGDAEYLIRCYRVDVMGIESVYVLAVPKNELARFDNSIMKWWRIPLVAAVLMLFMAISCFHLTIGRAAEREMYLRASLIKQKEATQQAERKNTNKSIAFATASHDVRTFLAGLAGMIEMSHHLVEPGSELHTNLKQMDKCAQDLRGLLNSILDTSKIEAGKMQLEEEEFDLSNLLEDVTDLYHPVAMKKGVDLVLDPCNGSVVRYSRVKGDRGKLKQVLGNLLSNAVKFTDEGHVAVRAWAQKPSFQNSSIITATEQRMSFRKRLWRLFFKENEARDRDDVEANVCSSIQRDAHSMDFVFEVDDTGKGIPKENYRSVFENYVQVKNNALCHGGTGLGLGIVQSLVRLMKGDIEILEKDMGERGARFRFNVLLTVCEYGSTREEEEGLQTCSSPAGSSICTLSPRLRIRSSSPARPQASRVILLIAGEERRRTTHKFMKSLGIKVKVVKRWENLSHALHSSRSPSSCISSRSENSSESSLSRGRGVPLSAMDGTTDQALFRKTGAGAAPGFILIVVDANSGPFHELCRVVSNFRRGLGNPCRVVWLDKQLHTRGINFKRSLGKDALDLDDVYVSKPFHGSCLFRVIELLPEYGGAWQSKSNKQSSPEISKESFVDKYCRGVGSKSTRYPIRRHEGGEVQECGGDSSKPLSGKKILMVEDSELMRMVALGKLKPLGPIVEQCQNGEEAVRLVSEGLMRDFPNPPYDYILMDCQMPVMDGFEATKRIRKMVERYGVRIPIIALTADTDKVSIEAGMDFRLEKPIKTEHLLEAIRSIHTHCK